MILKLPHFNFRKNLAILIVHNLARKSAPQVVRIALSTYSHILESSDEKHLDLKLTMVAALSKQI